MAKICPNCGNENNETLEFCENCGAFLDDAPTEIKSTYGELSWWNKQILLIKAYPAILLIPVALIIILSGLILSGDFFIDESSPLITSITVGNVSMARYSDESISFNFPEDFYEYILPSNITSGNSQMNIIKYLNNGAIDITIQKSSIRADPAYVRQTSDDLIIKNSSGEVLTHTTEINPNKLTIYKSINSLKDSTTNETVKCIDFYFNDKKGAVYVISTFGIESDYKAISKTAEVIFNSLKLN